MQPLSPLFGPPSTELPKPPVPYSPKWRFTAKSYTASCPTPVVRECCLNSESDSADRRQLRPNRPILKQPPLPGEEGYDTVSLEVIDLLKVGDGHNSQVFTVRLLIFESTSQQPLPQKGIVLVAKIYRPTLLRWWRRVSQPIPLRGQLLHVWGQCIYSPERTSRPRDSEILRIILLESTC